MSMKIKTQQFITINNRYVYNKYIILILIYNKKYKTIVKGLIYLPIILSSRYFPRTKIIITKQLF